MNDSIIFTIREILNYVGDRTKLISEKMYLILNQLPALKKYINEKDPKLNNDIFKDLGKYMDYKKFHKGKIIQSLCEGDNYFYMILSGTVAKLGIKYKKFYITFKEFINHLAKLQLFSENFLFRDCIEKNKDIFPFYNENMFKLLKNINNFNLKNELNSEIKEINSSKWKLNPNNINDYLEIINPNFSKNKNFFLSKEMKFSVYLPIYIVDDMLYTNSFIGDLKKPKGIKCFSSYICVGNVDTLYLNKSQLGSGCKINYHININMNRNVIKNILKKSIIFKNADIDYIIDNIGIYFKQIPVKRGDVLLSQNRPHEGIYFINNGVFQLKSKRSYNELNELIIDLKDSLNNFNNYISNIKNDDKNDLNKTINLKMFRNPMFITKSNEKKEIIFATYHDPQIIGLNEFYDNKNCVYNFSVNCISDDAEVYFLPNELVNNLLSIDCVYYSIARLIEERVKILLYGIQRFKNNFENEIERFLCLPKIQNNLLHKNNNFKKINIIDRNILKDNNLIINNDKKENNTPILNNRIINNNNISIELFSYKNIDKKINKLNSMFRSASIVSSSENYNKNYFKYLSPLNSNRIKINFNSMEKSEVNDVFKNRRLIKYPSSSQYNNKNINNKFFKRNEIFVSPFSEMKLINSKNNFCFKNSNEDSGKKYNKIKRIFDFNNNINFFKSKNKNFIEGNKCNNNKINGNNTMLKSVTLAKSSSCSVLI